MKTDGGVILNGALLCCLLATAGIVQAEDVDDAREALQQKETDVTSESNLEEVFQATQKQYSLLPSGQISMNFGASYSYFRDNQINIAIEEGQVTNFQIENDSQHSFGSSLSVDYGIWNNLTLNANFPVSYKYDTERDISKAALGDVSIGLRYQPFPIKPGAINTTLYTTLSTATGDSPYKIDVRNQLSSGKGYYSLGGGVSMSKVIDPVVLFGSVGYTHAFDVSGVSQSRGSRTLTGVDTGDSINFSFGMAYALSYEVSLSASYQQSYNFQSFFQFAPETDTEGNTINPRVGSADATSSVVNMSLGLRTAANRVINFSFGFGLTEDSPDVLMGFNVPVDFTGFKPGA